MLQILRNGVASQVGDGGLRPHPLHARSLSLLRSGNDKKKVEFGVN